MYISITKCSSDEKVENLFASIQSESNVTFHYHNHRIAFDNIAFCLSLFGPISRADLFDFLWFRFPPTQLTRLQTFSTKQPFSQLLE